MGLSLLDWPVCLLVIKASALLMSVMKAPVEKFVRTLAAVKDQMQEAA